VTGNKSRISYGGPEARRKGIRDAAAQLHRRGNEFDQRAGLGPAASAASTSISASVKLSSGMQISFQELIF
jgi:hypothetical protein